MWEFIRFVGKCILEGWEVGDHFFAFIESICFVAAAGVLWHRKHTVHEAWEKWEKWIMKAAFIIFMTVFLGSSLFYVPFHHHTLLTQANEQLIKDGETNTNDLIALRKQLAESDRARLKALED